MSELYLFDFDGVLCDSLAVSLSVVNELSGPYRFRPVDDPERLRALSSRELVAWLGIPWWKLPFVLRAARRHTYQRRAELRLFAGAREALAALRARGAAVGVLTSNSAEVVRDFDLPLDVLIAGVSLFGKARALRRVARGFDRVVYFGDETRDLEAARRAGVFSAAVSWGYAREELLVQSRPDFLCQSWEGVASVALSSF